jgi:hypothetical protein
MSRSKKSATKGKFAFLLGWYFSIGGYFFLLAFFFYFCTTKCKKINNLLQKIEVYTINPNKKH